MSTEIDIWSVRLLYMPNLEQRIETILREMDGPERGKKARLAKIAGCTRGLVNQWVNGPNKTMGYEYAKNIEDQLGYRVEWILSGTPPMKVDKKPSVTIIPNHGKDYGKQEKRFDRNIIPAPEGFLRPIPVISPVQAGRLKEITDPYPPGAGFDVEYTNDKSLSPWAFALEIEGVSMMPDFRPGDRIIVDPDLTPSPGDYVVARNTSDEATFKKYRPRGMDANGNMIFELVPLNPDYPTMRSDIDHLTIIGVVIEHRKKLRGK